MSHFIGRYSSPLISICAGYAYIAVLISILGGTGMYESSTFFRWGTPVTFMGITIEDSKIYYSLLLLFFTHQLINNWVNTVTYPWIINCVQDPKSKDLLYSKRTAMVIVNMFALYSELDVVFIVSGIMSQIAFFAAIIVANMISTTLINWQYIRLHPKNSLLVEELV